MSRDKIEHVALGEFTIVEEAPKEPIILPNTSAELPIGELFAGENMYPHVKLPKYDQFVTMVLPGPDSLQKVPSPINYKERIDAAFRHVENILTVSETNIPWYKFIEYQPRIKLDLARHVSPLVLDRIIKGLRHVLQAYKLSYAHEWHWENFSNLQLEALIYFGNHLIHPNRFELNGSCATINPFDELIAKGMHLCDNYEEFCELYVEFTERAKCEIIARRAAAIYAPFPSPQERSKLVLYTQIVDNMKNIPEFVGLEQALNRSFIQVYNDAYRKEYLKDAKQEGSSKDPINLGAQEPIVLPLGLTQFCDQWLDKVTTPYDNLPEEVLSNQDAETAAQNPQNAPGPWGPQGFLAKEAAKAVANGLNFKPLNKWSKLERDVFATTGWLNVKHPNAEDKQYIEPPTRYWGSEANDI